MGAPFVGPSYNLASRPASVQRTINLVPVPVEPGNERTAWVFADVPGLVEFATEFPLSEGIYVFSEPGTYTWNMPEGTVSVEAAVLGAGGGGGGGAHTGAASSPAGGGGGGGGGYASATFDAGDLTSSITIVVGAGGAGGSGGSSAAGTAGAIGGNSAFGPYLTGYGGGGGGGGANVNVVGGGGGGAGDDESGTSGTAALHGDGGAGGGGDGGGIGTTGAAGVSVVTSAGAGGGAGSTSGFAGGDSVRGGAGGGGGCPGLVSGTGRCASPDCRCPTEPGSDDRGVHRSGGRRGGGRAPRMPHRGSRRHAGIAASAPAVRVTAGA